MSAFVYCLGFGRSQSGQSERAISIEAIRWKQSAVFEWSPGYPSGFEKVTELIEPVPQASNRLSDQRIASGNVRLAVLVNRGLDLIRLATHHSLAEPAPLTLQIDELYLLFESSEVNTCESRSLEAFWTKPRFPPPCFFLENVSQSRVWGFALSWVPVIPAKKETFALRRQGSQVQILSGAPYPVRPCVKTWGLFIWLRPNGALGVP